MSAERLGMLVSVALPGVAAQLVDLAARTVSPAGRAAQEDSDWDVIGSADAWDQVISGTVNLSAALRACQLRYCDGEESHPLAADTRTAILGRLLGLASW